MGIAVRVRRRVLVPVAVTAALLTGLPGPTYAAGTDGPDYEMPFPCGDTWNGSSRYNHSPSALAIDWNRTDDLGAMMVAAAPGVVTSAVNLGNRSYGRYIVVDHGGGRSTLYAHLSAFWSTTGQAVDQGTPLGLVGTSGGSTGPHLHFEERLNRADHRSYFHRRPFVMGTTQASQGCGDVPVIGDWDGNGAANVGVQRRGTTPTFVLKRPHRAALRVPFGWRTDQPLSGDWDGDRTIDIGVRRPGTQQFVLRARDGATTTFALGRVSDTGVSGDWEGDGRTNVGVWSPSTRIWTIRMADTSTRAIRFGSLGDRPVTGDWDGDGNTDLGVFSAGTAIFTLRTVSRTGAVTLRKVPWGTSTSLPVSGDWNGDGIDDIGVWDPATAAFSLRLTPTAAHPAAVTRTPRWGLPRG